MATIESYQTAAGKRYQVRYRTPQQTQTKKRGFKTKRDAQEFAATVEVEKMTGTYVAPKLGMITVSELAPAWVSRKESDVAPSNYLGPSKQPGASTSNRYGEPPGSRMSILPLSSVGSPPWVRRRGRRS